MSEHTAMQLAALSHDRFWMIWPLQIRSSVPVSNPAEDTEPMPP